MSLETIVIIGSGGRESALVEKYSQSPHVGKIIAIPGNDLMKFVSRKFILTFPNVHTTNKKEILKVCLEHKVSLVDIAQDDAVAKGVADVLLRHKIKVIGPTKKAGKIEWSKSFSRKLLKKAGIPQPEFKIFKSPKEGISYLKEQPDQAWFVKADGLARGKGAMPAKNNKVAIEKIKELSQFGKAGEKYLLEKWIKHEGQMAEEFSAFAIADGKTFQILGFAQDHKRAFDHDLGENTGGMGASYPPLAVDKNIKTQVHEIFKKTFETLRKNGSPYVGVLFLGGLIVGKKVYVVEFNARWGDPEAQVIVPAIKNDFYELSSAVASGKLKNTELKISSQPRVSVAIAHYGYPSSSKYVGREIKNLEKFLNQKDAKIYGAGIKYENSKFYTTGGRAFHIVAEGKDMVEARGKVYDLINKIVEAGNKLHFRRDIGWRDINRLE